MLKVDNITAGYGDTQVLFGTSLEINKGEVVAIVGSNGVGKTTLLRAMSGVIRPTAGKVTHDGVDVTGRPCHELVERGLVLVPEGRRLFPRMSVRRNLELGAFSRRARAHVAERLEYVYDLFPILKEREQQLGGTLSGGQQQMCAIARGLVSVPDVLMLDEVSLGLAPVAISRVYDAIRAIRDTGVTLVIVEQNISQALAVADRAYVIQNGRVALSGTGEQLAKNADVRRIYLGLAPTREEETHDTVQT